MAHSHTPRTRCVRFVFGIAAASRNTRFQAACWALPGPDFHRRIAPADWRLLSFDHLVGASEHGRRNFEAQSLRRFEVDNQIEFGGLLDRNIAGLLPRKILSTNSAVRRN